MAGLIKLNYFLARICQCLGIAVLFTMMMITITDIVTRTLFSFTSGLFPWFVKGSVELVSYGLLLSLLAGFAGFVERAQIIVDIFNEHFSTRTQQIMSVITLIFYAVLGLMLTFGLIENIIMAMEYGEITQDLRIPLSYIYCLAALFTSILALRALLAASIIAFSTPTEVKHPSSSNNSC